jgi:Tol biopolymer transport system component/tRNA A-37 threonylcarbamoyl transferase component Bud32
MIGTTISHYQIVEKLGEGGMGVVYKARDLRLDRFVCIKILRPEQVKDESRKQRFIQEAKAASSLNHPNIVTIHEIDWADGTDFMVMEFVAGKTLQQLIPGGGMPIADVFKYAIPIARALAAANAAGIIHRDVKPGNIIVGANGIVKVLDFGLAKLTAPETSAADETQTQTAHTEEGTIMGTAAYMSPEQAQGKPVDARSDIFSFGAMLYEMIGGRRAFQGANTMSTLAAILEKEPAPLAERDSRIPRELERMVMRCLRKDPERRFQSMADLRVELEDLKEESDSGKLTPVLQPSQVSRGRPWLIYGLAAALVLLAAAVGWVLWHPQPAKTVAHPFTRLTYTGAAVFPAISRDGKLLAYQAAIDEPNPDIWVQQIGGGKAIQITHEKEGAALPAFSPDGTQIAYQRLNGGIYEVPALGGDARLIDNNGYRPVYAAGGSTIVFQRTVGTDDHLFRVARIGGTPVAIQPELSYEYGAVSPDGSKLLALAYRKNKSEQDIKRWWLIPISAGKLEDVAPPSLLPGESHAPIPFAWTMPDGGSGRQWTIFSRQIGDTNNLFRAAITGDGKVTSDPEQLTFTSNSFAPTISENGRMVFLNAEVSTNLWSIPTDTNRARLTGERQSLTRVEGVRDKSPAVSHDGKKVAFFSGSNLIVKDLVTGHETQLAQDVRVNGGTGPSISPDGSFVIYYDFNKGANEFDLYSISTAGGQARLVCRACGQPKGFSSDGTHLLTQEGYRASGRGKIALVEIATGKMTVVLDDPQHTLWNAFYSWDDKWMVFLMQIQTGVTYRVYITPVENLVPAGPDRWIQLTSGEHHDDKPQFSPDGNTMYFTSNRDGFICMWALRLDPKTKHPVGDPFPVQHFHGSQRIYAGISNPADIELSVANDKILTCLDEFHSDIWMTELDPGK